MRLQSYLAEKPWFVLLAAAALTSACVAQDADADDSSSEDEVTEAEPEPEPEPEPEEMVTEEATEPEPEDEPSSDSDEEAVDCSEITVVTDAEITNFDGYAGGAADTYEFNFNGDADGEGAIYGGLFPLDDKTGDYTLEFVEGADGSGYAVSAHDSAAGSTPDGWGGGFGMWHGCMDASAYEGIQFMIMGSTPTGTAEVAIRLPDNESVVYDFSVPDDWTLLQVPFDSFVGGDGSPSATTDGSEVGALAFAAHLEWVPSEDDSDVWVPSQGAFEITVDDLSFY